MSAIELRGVQKRYADVSVLADVDLDIEQGQFCVLLGPSGCGKSTLLRLIAGLDDPSDGDIRIGGQRVNDMPPAQRDVGMVFQSYALYPHMSVYENMAFGLRHRKLGRDEIDHRVRRAAESLHLSELLARKPAALSGGQRQRVAIGRAVVREPRVFLFDEPLSNLDAALRVKTRVEIARLHRALGNTSMVYVTHDQVEAMTLATQIVLLRPLKPGSRELSIAQVGTPMALYHAPANLFVAGFIGSPPMNLFSGRLLAGGPSGARLQVAGQELDAAVQAPAALDGSRITLGIRPEHVALGSGSFHGEVSHVEQLGELAYVYLHTALSDQPMVVKVEATQARIGDRVAFALPAASVHVFDERGDALARLAV